MVVLMMKRRGAQRPRTPGNPTLARVGDEGGTGMPDGARGDVKVARLQVVVLAVCSAVMKRRGAQRPSTPGNHTMAR